MYSLDIILVIINDTSEEIGNNIQDRAEFIVQKITEGPPDRVGGQGGSR